MASDELVEVIAEDASVLRVVTRAQVRAGRLRHRCTFVVIRSTTGDVLVHLRSDDKDLWPGRWDLCAGGVVTAGESWENAARREVCEELGVQLGAGADLEPLGEFSYDDAEVSELCRVWTTVHDGPFTFADGEVSEARFVSVDDLVAMLDEVPFTPDSATVVAPLVVGNRRPGGAD